MQNFDTLFKTPAQRARLKVYFHLVIGAILTGAITGLGLIDQFKTIGISQIAVSAITTAVMALADGARKYMQASGEVPQAAAVASVETAIAQNTPTPVAPTALGQQIEAQAQQFIAPIVTDVAVVSSNPAVDAGPLETVDTFPNIAIVKAQFAKPVVHA